MTNTLKLRSIMLEKGINYRELAKQIGVSTTTLGNKINNVSIFNIDEVERICDILDIADPSVKCEIFLAKVSQ